MKKDLVARRYIVSGRVQGVGFRYYVEDVAGNMGVQGFVRNRRDGCVEVLGIGTPEQPVNRRDKNIRSWYMTGMRFGLYFLEAISLRTTAARKRDADVLIFDRYLYDQLANLPMQRFFTRMYARLLLKLVPSLDIAYLLDADPNQARARKPEYPIEFLHALRASYAILSRIGRMTLVAPGSVAEVSEVITESFLQKCPQIEMKKWVGGIPQPRSTEQRA